MGRWCQPFQVSRPAEPPRAGRQGGWGHHLCGKTATAGRAPWSVTGGHRREVFPCQRGVLAQAGDLRITQAATCPLSSPGQFHKELLNLPAPANSAFVRQEQRETNHAFHRGRQASARVRDKGPRGEGTRCRDLRSPGPTFCLCPDCPSAQSSP